MYVQGEQGRKETTNPMRETGTLQNAFELTRKTPRPLTLELA